MIDTPLRPTQSTSNAIRPTSPDFAPPTARAKTQAHQVYSSPISTVSKLCGTAVLGEDDPNTNRPASATVCTRLNPIAARFTHSQPGVPTGVRVLSILLPLLPQPEPKRACPKFITRSSPFRLVINHTSVRCAAPSSGSMVQSLRSQEDRRVKV